ncbi:bifunctional methylenetetrahydrofolate dehydrogenase/methenyltetrahydrofolate cyclohydrolase FolD [Buchnera aphidicola (Therioaphis trifolii)]|uniref:Bifunctional protein FolD n=1 Tax=Buchnera aphidicola (Therioaphis trifolii) TaxID=1241884 RepID=A0A4D6YMH9_9GAMM|nr:bifunctional methylenetetrahydrofolate dehydrogenase/methenyltetrahydrofolate cyclohydrolase FolD [Buchnera aphidicola]QCI27400.1 bifunctional methylenetetrahydrofolate dehydrogenase/methenyltetrahydrofolate cyclohydrolase FolD [Buchnera aphidicola (Therioaphis trifolii)]
MSNKIINGKEIAETIIQKIKKTVQHETRFRKRPPGLAVIWTSNNLSSKLYVQKKKIACNQVGFFSEEWNLKNNITEIEIINLIKKLNLNHKIDGILVQLPLPKNINTMKIIESINPKKDVDGFHPYNIGCLCQKKPKLRPCTPRGIITLLKQYNINLYGINATIIGASNIVGRPMGLELLLSGCTTTITHRFTINIKEHIKKSNLIIVAVGKPNFLDDKYIKSKPIIIDVGINRLPYKNKIIGDVNFKKVLPKVSYITPVPGGVGPMTVATLLKNTLEAYQEKYQYNI